MNKRISEWIVGKNALMEALDSEQSLQKIYLADHLDSQILNEWIKRARKHKISVLKVPKYKLDKLCPANHQGILALINPIQFADTQDLVTKAFEEGINPIMVLLDGVTDVHNFGAIARSAEVLGVTGLIIGKKSSAPINHEAIKISSGALLRIPVCKETSLYHCVRNLKKMGLHVIGADEKASQAVYQSDLKKPLLLILGSEGEGISKELLTQVDENIRIPQMGKINSLNVSVAAGIVFYEIQRQQISKEREHHSNPF